MGLATGETAPLMSQTLNNAALFATSLPSQSVAKLSGHRSGLFQQIQEAMAQALRKERLTPHMATVRGAKAADPKFSICTTYIVANETRNR